MMSAVSLAGSNTPVKPRSCVSSISSRKYDRKPLQRVSHKKRVTTYRDNSPDVRSSALSISQQCVGIDEYSPVPWSADTGGQHKAYNGGQPKAYNGGQPKAYNVGQPKAYNVGQPKACSGVHPKWIISKMFASNKSARSVVIQDSYETTPSQFVGQKKALALTSLTLTSLPLNAPVQQPLYIANRYKCIQGKELNTSVSSVSVGSEFADADLEDYNEPASSKATPLCVIGTRQKLPVLTDVLKTDHITPKNHTVVDMPKESLDRLSADKEADFERESTHSPSNPPPSPVNWDCMDWAQSSTSRDFNPGFVESPVSQCGKYEGTFVEGEQSGVACQRRPILLANCSPRHHEEEVSIQSKYINHHRDRWKEETKKAMRKKRRKPMTWKESTTLITSINQSSTTSRLVNSKEDEAEFYGTEGSSQRSTGSLRWLSIYKEADVKRKSIHSISNHSHKPVNLRRSLDGFLVGDQKFPCPDRTQSSSDFNYIHDDITPEFVTSALYQREVVQEEQSHDDCQKRRSLLPNKHTAQHRHKEVVSTKTAGLRAELHHSKIFQSNPDSCLAYPISSLSRSNSPTFIKLYGKKKNQNKEEIDKDVKHYRHRVSEERYKDVERKIGKSRKKKPTNGLVNRENDELGSNKTVSVSEKTDLDDDDDRETMVIVAVDKGSSEKSTESLRWLSPFIEADLQNESTQSASGTSQKPMKCQQLLDMVGSRKLACPNKIQSNITFSYSHHIMPEFVTSSLYQRKSVEEEQSDATCQKKLICSTLTNNRASPHSHQDEAAIQKVDSCVNPKEESIKSDGSNIHQDQALIQSIIDMIERVGSCTHQDQAMIQSAGSRTHQDQAMIHSASSRTHQDQAIIHSAISSIHLDQAMIPSVGSSNHPDQAMIQSASSSTHQDQAMIQSAGSSTHQDQAMIQSAGSRTHQDQALLQSVGSSTHPDQVLIQSCGSSTHQDQAMIQSMIQSAGSSTHQDQALILNAGSRTHQDQALLQSVGSSTHQDQALILNAGSRTHQDQALILNAGSRTHQDEALLQSVGSSTHPDQVLIQSCGSSTQPDQALIQNVGLNTGLQRSHMFPCNIVSSLSYIISTAPRDSNFRRPTFIEIYGEKRSQNKEIDETVKQSRVSRREKRKEDVRLETRTHLKKIQSGTSHIPIEQSPNTRALLNIDDESAKTKGTIGVCEKTESDLDGMCVVTVSEAGEEPRCISRTQIHSDFPLLPVSPTCYETTSSRSLQDGNTSDLSKVQTIAVADHNGQNTRQDDIVDDRQEYQCCNDTGALLDTSEKDVLNTKFEPFYLLSTCASTLRKQLRTPPSLIMMSPSYELLTSDQSQNAITSKQLRTPPSLTLMSPSYELLNSDQSQNAITSKQLRTPPSLTLMSPSYELLTSDQSQNAITSKQLRTPSSLTLMSPSYELLTSDQSQNAITSTDVNVELQTTAYQATGYQATGNNTNDLTMTTTVIIPRDTQSTQWVTFNGDNEPVLNHAPSVDGGDTFLKRLQRSKLYSNTDPALPAEQQFCFKPTVDKRYNRWKRRRRKKKNIEIQQLAKPSNSDSSDENEDSKERQLERIIDRMYDQMNGPAPLTPNGTRDTPRLRNRRRREEPITEPADEFKRTEDSTEVLYDESSEWMSTDSRDGWPLSSLLGTHQFPRNSASNKCRDTGDKLSDDQCADLEHYKEDRIPLLKNTPSEQRDSMDINWLPDITCQLNGSRNKNGNTPDSSSSQPTYTDLRKSYEGDKPKLLSRTISDLNFCEMDTNPAPTNDVKVYAIEKADKNSDFKADLRSTKRNDSMIINSVFQPIKVPKKPLQMKRASLNLPTISTNQNTQIVINDYSGNVKKQDRNTQGTAKSVDFVTRPKIQPKNTQSERKSDPSYGSRTPLDIFRDYSSSNNGRGNSHLDSFNRGGGQIKRTVTVGTLDLGTRKPKKKPMDKTLLDQSFTRSFTYSLFDLPEFQKLYNDAIERRANGEHEFI